MSRPLSTPQGSASTGTAGGLDEAELCHSLAEFHGEMGRVVIGMVLRNYLDSQVLTPTEVIHSNKLLKPLLDQGQLAESAIVKVAMVQARLPGQDQKARRMAIQKAIDETSAKARVAQVAFNSLPKGRSPVDAVLAAAGKGTPTGNADYDLRVALALELSELRTWAAKLDRLIELFQGDRDERLSAAVDGAIGDVLASVGATLELFGASLLTGELMLALCDTMFGRVPMEAMGPKRIGVLNGWFRQGKLPRARAMALERIRRQLRAPQPLLRGAAQPEAEALHRLLAHLLTPAGVVGGGPMADALTVRYSRRLEQGGASAYRRSIVGLGDAQADLIRRVHFFAAVSTVGAADRHAGEIVDAIDAALGNELLVENMVLQTPDLALTEQMLAGAAAALRASGLPEADRARLAGRAETVVDDYARRGGLMQRLRQIEPVSLRRTIRLAELACSSLVRDEGALPLLRQQIVDIVRQPGFQTDLATAQGDEMAQAEVRRLYELLDRLRQNRPAPSLSASAPVTDGGSGGVSAARTGRTAPTAPTAPTPRQRATPAPPPSADHTVATMMVPTSAPAGPPPSLVACPSCFALKPAQGACRECGYPTRMDNRPGLHLAPGSVLLGRYKVGRVLGQGGFGTTYLGWDDRLRVKVAIKEYLPTNLVSRVPAAANVAPFSDEHARSFSVGLTKFLEEARLLARLRDVKEIVSVQDFFEENATAYLVMELLEGRTLKKYVGESGGRVDPKRTLTILSPIMRALQAVHEQGLVHRDISPDNIFLTASGERKLLDFGAARQTASQEANLTVILKPGYAPPEQYAQDGKQGPWTDVYATCATVWYALTGKAPPDATSRFMSDKVPRLAELGAAVPPAFEKALLSGLAMRWQDRPQSMRELLRALNAALG